MLSNFDMQPPADPWTLFREWFALAGKHEPEDPEAMALATTGADGMPSVRMVLLKGYEDGDLVFFTNRHSRKGEQLLENPKAGLCFYWKSLNRQIRAEGVVGFLEDAESDAYFATRSRASQIGAWASLQSKPLATRSALEERMRTLEKQYENKPLPRPSWWGGYRLTPFRIEFWQEREFRLHDRIVYHRADPTEAWAMERLYP